MKWVGQHIYDLVSKFRNTVDFSKDVTFYQPINDANPAISIGASDEERLRIMVNYQGTTTTSAQEISFRSYTESATANDGMFAFIVDGTSILHIDDDGINFAENMGISINETLILTDIGGVATLSNIDALDATTIATFEAAIESNIDTITNDLTISTTGTQLTLAHNANDYATFIVADTGDLSIATVGDGTRDSDLILTADGEIELNSVNGLDMNITGGWDCDTSGAVRMAAAGAASDINITTAHTAGAAFTINANADAGSIVDINAGILDIDVTGNTYLDTALLWLNNPTASSATEGGQITLVTNDGALTADDHRFGVLEFRGMESSDASNIGAKIEGFADATWGTNENAGRLVFSTNNGNDNLATVLTLDKDKLATFAGAVMLYNTNTSSSTAGGQLRLVSDDGAALADNHRLGAVNFYAAEDSSNNLQRGASIAAYADAAWSASENGTRLEFYTMDGDASSELSLTLDSDLLATFTGNVNIDNATTSSASQGGVLRLISDDGAALEEDHRLGIISFKGSESASSANNKTGAKIECFADDDWSASENGARMVFSTNDADNSLSTVLTLDSDLLATFAGAVTVTGTITGDVTGDVTGNVSGTAATVTTAAQPAIESIGTDGDTLSILSDTLYMANTSASSPTVSISNQADDATGPQIAFTNHRKDGGGTTQAGEDDDILGTMLFQGYDDQGTPAAQNYAKIYADIHDATSGEESGRLTLQVANHDGGMGDGLILTGGSADNVIDVQLGLGAASVVRIPGDLQVNGDTVTFESANADDPAVIIKNTTDDDQASRLVFEKLRDDDGVASGQNLGEIWFKGQDSAQNTEDYAVVYSEIDVSTSGQESGILKLAVAAHDGGTKTGLILTGGSEGSEVDVTVGLGANSVTTVAGDLAVTGSVVGLVAVLRCSAFYVNDNPFVQNNLYFGNTTGSQPMNWNDPAAVGGVIGDTSSFAIAGDDEKWGILLPFNISKIDVKCSLRPQLGTGDDFTIAIYTGIRSEDSSADLTLTKVAHNSVALSSSTNRYTRNDVSVTANYNAGTMIYVGVGSEDATDAKNGQGYMNITVTTR